MVIKILSSSASFSGVGYNERKNAQGKSELLMARNFGSLEMKQGEVSKADYINYLKDYSATNARVKNPQFHAILSCKGRESTPEELCDLAEQYLANMGYGDNPYLIYSHSDTPNNHVHIITSRIDQQGAQIDHSFERVRTQNFINSQVLQQNPEQTFVKRVQEAAAYKFSTAGQFRQLLEREGYHSQAEPDRISFSKGGRAVGAIMLDTISPRLTVAEHYDKGRINQVRQLFQKYRLSHDPRPEWEGDKRPGRERNEASGHFCSDFSRHMEKTFGLELIFHQANNQEIQGYTIIDHSAKQVYKGSEIMNLRDLVDLPQLHPEEIVAELTLQHLHEGKGFNALRQQLKDSGLLLNQRGEVRKRGIPQPFRQLDTAMMRQLRSDDKLMIAKSYAGGGERELLVIAALCGVDAKRLVASETVDLSAIRKKMNSALNNSDNLNDTLNAISLRLVPMENELFILDEKEKLVVNCNKIVTAETAQRLKSSPEYHSNLVNDDPSVMSGPPTLIPQLRLSRQFIDAPDAAPTDLARLLGAIGDEHDPAESAAKRRRRKN